MKAEKETLENLNIRIKYLQQFFQSLSSISNYIDYDIIIADYFYRYGYTEAGDIILDGIKQSKDPLRIHLSDRDILIEIYQASSILRNNHTLHPVLQWCHNYGSRLRRMESTIEFSLHRQQFIEYLRVGKKQQAIEYASSQLAPAVPSNSTETIIPPSETSTTTVSSTNDTLRTTMIHQLQTAMSALAFADPQHCNVPEIEKLFSLSEWKVLGELFMKEAYRAVGLPIESSILETLLTIGITVTKCDTCVKSFPQVLAKMNKHTIHRHEMIPTDTETSTTSTATNEALSSLSQPITIPISDNAENNCPICTIPEYFVVAAANIPSLRHSVSKIYDSITHEFMDSAFSFPNGYIYSQKTLANLITPDSKYIFCPHTGEIFTVNDTNIKRVYFV